MSDIKKKVEAVLFSAGKRLSVDELARLCRAKPLEVLENLEQLRKEYDEKQSSLVIVNDDSHWKFSVREQFVSVVRKVVAETELTKSVLETLAVIAYRYPILQSDLIKIRTNKAYDHLIELEKSGYISRKKKGRTNLLMLTDKFFGYFDLAPDKLKEKFRDFDSIARAIEERETESKRIKSDQRKYAEEAKQQDDR
ncbi:SMC-Scp complex subunit ScpB, partial [Candidatus Woesearchaeota archaeon]|nr:SMC-Scp complex subunit ScpB [Candidatus Woesearchaeota archaeon]